MTTLLNVTPTLWTNGEFISPALLVLCFAAIVGTAALVAIFTDKNPGKCN